MFPLQLPLTLAMLACTTRKAWEFFWNSYTLGFSFTRPHCLCRPKNFSRGSCVIRLLKNGGASGRLSNTRASSINDFTVEILSIIIMYAHLTQHTGNPFVHTPITFNPVDISTLNSIVFFSASLKPFLCATTLSQSSKYLRKSVSNH